MNTPLTKHLTNLLKQGFLHAVFALLFYSMIAEGIAWAKVDFEYLNGSDIGLGIGARAIGMGGAFTAVADDASTIFWNPAGLAQIPDNQIFFSGDYPKEFSSAGVIYHPNSKILKQFKFTFGISMVNHLRFQGDSGDEVWDDYAFHMLYLAMVDASDDFSGAIRSQTMDIRLSAALAPLKNSRFLLGFNFKHID